MTSLCRFGLSFMLMSLLALSACKKDKPSTTADAGVANDASTDAAVEPVINFKKGPKPTPDTVVASSGPYKATWADYQHAVRVGRLFAPSTPDGGTEELTKETLATPNLQVMMARSLLARKIVRAGVEQRGVEITDDEIRASLDNHNRLSRWSRYWDEPKKMEAELGKLGVTVEDFKRVGFEQVTQEKLQQLLVEEIDDSEAWKAYQYDKNTAQIVGVSVLNVPSADELDQFTETREDEIKKYFKDNETRYTYPARGEAVLLVPADPNVEKAALEAAAADLAVANSKPAEVAKKHGLTIKEGQRFTNAEDSAIFAAKLGDTGVTWKSPRGTYVWKKVATLPPTPRELSFGLKREIAATIIRESRVTEDAAEKLAEAQKILGEAELEFGEVTRESVKPLVEKLSALGVEAKLTPPFPRAQNGFVPGFGIHESLANAAFSADKKDPYPDGPVLSRERAFTFRLVGRSEPTRAQFEKERDEYLKQFRMRAQQGIVDRFVNDQFTKESPDIKLDPVHVVYGQLEKPRN